MIGHYVGIRKVVSEDLQPSSWGNIETKSAIVMDHECQMHWPVWLGHSMLCVICIWHDIVYLC